MAWEFELLDLSGTTVGLVRPRSVKITRNLNAASSIELEVEDVAAPTPAAALPFFDPFNYAADVTVQAANPTVWQSSVWGDPDIYATGDGTLYTNRPDGGWAGASSIVEYGDTDVIVEVATAAVVNGVLEVYALQSTADDAMVMAHADASAGELRLYQSNAAGAYTLLDEVTGALADGDRFGIRVRGTTIQALLNGEVVATATHTLGRSTGLVGFETNDNPTRLGSITVRPTGADVVTPDTGLDLTTAALVRGWRAPAGGGARVLRAVGKVKSALQLSVARDALDTLSVTAADGYGVVQERLAEQTYTFAAQTPYDILFTVLANQNLRAWVGLNLSADAEGGPPRDRTYEQGKNVGEIIQQLAEVDDGYYFRVDPVDLELEPITGNLFSWELVLKYPSPGGTSAASFEYGEGTAANLSRVQVDVRPPINYVTAFGAGTGDDQLVAVAYDQDSIDAFGLVDASRSFSDVIEQATLDQHAVDMLRPAERRTFKVEVASSTGNGELHTPSPWDDFDVGDTVQLNIRTTRLTYTGRALVRSFTVTVDANGVERLASLDFQQED